MMEPSGPEGSKPSASTSGTPRYRLDKTFTGAYEAASDILQSEEFVPYIDPLLRDIAAPMNEPNPGPAATRNAANLMYFALDLLGGLTEEEGYTVLHEPTAR